MLRQICSLAVILMVLLPAVVLHGDDGAPAEWRHTLDQRLDTYGEGNWIVVADRSFPALASPGVEVITADDDQMMVIETVFEAISRTQVFRGEAISCLELAHIPETDAPGITKYRDRLSQLLDAQTASTLPLAKAQAMIEDTSQHLRILVIKTKSVLPYSSVFIRLASSTWTPDAEKRLRDSLGASK